MRPAAALAALLPLLATPAAARDRGGIEGDGKPETQRRDVGAFEAIRLDTAADVSVRVGGERAVSVTIDGNLQRHLETGVRGGALVIRTDERIHPRTPVRVEVTVPALRRFELSGSGDVRLEGRADRLDVSVEGSGDVDAANLVAKDVAAKVDGSGDVDVRVAGGSLSAAVSGSGDIRWRGEAKMESVAVSGSGSVAKKD